MPPGAITLRPTPFPSKADSNNHFPTRRATGDHPRQSKPCLHVSGSANAPRFPNLHRPRQPRGIHKSSACGGCVYTDTHTHADSHKTATTTTTTKVVSHHSTLHLTRQTVHYPRTQKKGLMPKYTVSDHAVRAPRFFVYAVNTITAPLTASHTCPACPALSSAATAAAGTTETPRGGDGLELSPAFAITRG